MSVNRLEEGCSCYRRKQRNWSRQRKASPKDEGARVADFMT